MYCARFTKLNISTITLTNQTKFLDFLFKVNTIKNIKNMFQIGSLNNLILKKSFLKLKKEAKLSMDVQLSKNDSLLNHLGSIIGNNNVNINASNNDFSLVAQEIRKKVNEIKSNRK